MITKAAKKQRNLTIGRDLIVINQVESEAILFRILINSEFCGFIQLIENEFYRLDGHNIHNLIFA